MRRKPPITAATAKPPRYVYVPMLTCPDCGGTDLAGRATLPPAGDGSISRYYACRDCGRRLIVVREPKIASDSEVDPDDLPYSSAS